MWITKSLAPPGSPKKRIVVSIRQNVVEGYSFHEIMSIYVAFVRKMWWMWMRRMCTKLSVMSAKFLRWILYIVASMSLFTIRRS